tara:strand:+ start:2684 stop:3061 length:378 start_codon:yes stop_codon:yes gene_type:complete
MGEIFLLGPLFGGGYSAFKDSTEGLGNACKELAEERSKMEQTKNQVQSAFKSAPDVPAIKSNSEELKNLQASYSQKLTNYSNQFKKRQALINIFLASFIFSLFIALLLRKFKIFSKIWNLIVNKK